MPPSSNPKTILQVLPALNSGGAEQTSLDINAALVKAGYVSLVASSGGRLEPQIHKNGGHHIALPLHRKNPLALWRNYLKLKAFIEEWDVDLIHARSRGPAWSALWAARKTKIKFVTTYHGSYTQTNRMKAFYNSVMARGDVVIANSHWTADHIRARHPDLENKIETIYRGTDFDTFQKSKIEKNRLQKLQASWRVGENKRIVLKLARLARWKGHGVVIEAAKAVVKQHPDVQFVFAGDTAGRDTYVAELQEQIEAARLQDHVSIVGHCDDPAAAMAMADCVVVASTQAEAFGRAAVEASALEAPVIVSRIGATQETVIAEDESNEFTGWKTQPGNAGELADAINSVLSLDDKSKKAITSRARKHVVKEFSLKQMCDQTLSVYKSLLG